MGVRIQPEQIFRWIENNFLFFIHKVNAIKSKNKQFKPYNGVAQDRVVFENSTTASDKHVNGKKKITSVCSRLQLTYISRREPSSSIQYLQFEMGPTRPIHQSSLLLLKEQRLALHFKRVSTWLCCRPRLAHDSVDLWIYGRGVLPKNKPWCQQFPKQLNFLFLMGPLWFT